MHCALTSQVSDLQPWECVGALGCESLKHGTSNFSRAAVSLHEQASVSAYLEDPLGNRMMESLGLANRAKPPVSHRCEFDGDVVTVNKQD